MRVLVTGGAGYIGTTLVPLLLEKQHTVTIYDIFKWGIDPVLSFAGNPSCKIVYGDINDTDRLSDVMKDQDAIIHLAAIVGYPACNKDPKVATVTNVLGTRNVVELKTPDQILIFASTGSCYGSVEGICTEKTTISPLTLYGKTKADAEELVVNAGGIALRLATVFGLSPRLRLDLLINDLSYKAAHEKYIELYEGHFRRTFLHVKDAAAAFVFAFDNAEVMKGQAYNVGDESMNMTKLQVAKLIQTFVDGCIIKECNTGVDLDKRDYEVSYGKIRKLGFRSEIPIEQGVRDLFKAIVYIKETRLDQYRNN